MFNMYDLFAYTAVSLGSTSLEMLAPIVQASFFPNSYYFRRLYMVWRLPLQLLLRIAFNMLNLAWAKFPEQHQQVRDVRRAVAVEIAVGGRA